MEERDYSMKKIRFWSSLAENWMRKVEAARKTSIKIRNRRKILVDVFLDRYIYGGGGFGKTWR